MNYKKNLALCLLPSPDLPHTQLPLFPESSQIYIGPCSFFSSARSFSSCFPHPQCILYAQPCPALPSRPLCLPSCPAWLPSLLQFQLCFSHIVSSLFAWHQDYWGWIWRLELGPGPSKSSANDCPSASIMLAAAGTCTPWRVTAPQLCRKKTHLGWDSSFEVKMAS